MRVIAGSLGGRVIMAPRGRGTRPTSERVREALFSSLGNMHDLVVFDLYAGSGALAIEALSRGARRALCVERSDAALRCLRQNLVQLDLVACSTVVALAVGRAASAIRQAAPFDLLLADPPWADVPAGRFGAALGPLLNDVVLAPDARLVVEHAARDEPPELPGATVDRTRRYGDTALTHYRWPAQ